MYVAEPGEQQKKYHVQARLLKISRGNVSAQRGAGFRTILACRIIASHITGPALHTDSSTRKGKVWRANKACIHSQAKILVGLS